MAIYIDTYLEVNTRIEILPSTDNTFYNDIEIILPTLLEKVYK